jgi:hypothetical protein
MSNTMKPKITQRFFQVSMGKSIEAGNNELTYMYFLYLFQGLHFYTHKLVLLSFWSITSEIVRTSVCHLHNREAMGRNKR